MHRMDCKLPVLDRHDAFSTPKIRGCAGYAKNTPSNIHTYTRNNYIYFRSRSAFAGIRIPSDSLYFPVLEVKVSVINPLMFRISSRYCRLLLNHFGEFLTDSRIILPTI